MAKVLLLCEVAGLSRELESDYEVGELPTVEQFGLSRDDFDNMLHVFDDANAQDDVSVSSNTLSTAKSIRSNKPIVHPRELLDSGSLTDKHKSLIIELLGAW